MYNIIFIPSTKPGGGIGNFRRSALVAEACSFAEKRYFSVTGEFKKHLTKLNWVYAVSPVFDGIDDDMSIAVIDNQDPDEVFALVDSLKHKWPNIRLVVLDHKGAMLPHSVIYVNLRHYGNDLSRSDNSVYCGLEYAIIPSSFQRVRRRVDCRRLVETVLVTFGGEDPLGHTLRVIQWLESEYRSPLNVFVLLGPMNRTLHAVEEATRSSRTHNYKVTGFRDDPEALMNDCDLVFCGAGATLMEVAFLGKPPVVLPQNEAEDSFLEELQSRGYSAVNALLPDGGISNEVVSLLRDHALRQSVATLGQGVFDGMGVHRIASIIKGSVNKQKEPS